MSGAGSPYQQFNYSLNDLNYPVENAPLPEWQIIGQQASDAAFGLERQAGSLLAYEAAGSGDVDTALLGPQAAEYVDPHTLNQQYGDLGLSFDKPMRRAQANILVNQRRDEIQRNYTLAHGPGGFWNTTANIATQLAVGAADPGNVAAALVPGVGEARAAMAVEKFGPTLGRLGVGAVEGGAGMAALQPLEYAHAKAFQDEYGPMDAFMNVAFGTALGGGLHMAFGGGTSAALDSLHPETREAALRGAVAQQAEGRPVDVGAIVASDPAAQEFDRLASGQGTPVADAEDPFAPLTPEAPTEPSPADTGQAPEQTPASPVAVSEADIAQAAADLKTLYSKEPTDTSLFGQLQHQIRTRDAEGNLTPEGGDLMSIIGDNPAHVMRLVNNRQGFGTANKGDTIDNIVTKLQGEGWLHPDADTNDLTDLIRREAGGEKIYHPESEIYAQLATRKVFEDEAEAAGINGDEPREEQARMLAEFRAANWAKFAEDEYRDNIGGEDGLSPHAQEVLHGDDDWIGSDEWFRQESAGASGLDEAAPEGVSAADAGPVPQSAGFGGGAATRGASEGAGGLRGQFADALDRTQTATKDFAQGKEPSTLVPPGASAEAGRLVASKAGDDIDEELAHAHELAESYHANGIFSDEEMDALKAAAAEDMERAQLEGKAAKAAAACLWLHP